MLCTCGCECVGVVQPEAHCVNYLASMLKCQNIYGVCVVLNERPEYGRLSEIHFTDCTGIVEHIIEEVVIDVDRVLALDGNVVETSNHVDKSPALLSIERENRLQLTEVTIRGRPNDSKLPYLPGPTGDVQLQLSSAFRCDVDHLHRPLKV